MAQTLKKGLKKMTSDTGYLKTKLREIPGRVPGEKGFRVVDEIKMAVEANKAKKAADYANSPAGLAKETIKGLPKAAGTVAKRILGWPVKK